MKLEEKIIKLRKRNAWSQEELAEKLDCDKTNSFKMGIRTNNSGCRQIN